MSTRAPPPARQPAAELYAALGVMAAVTLLYLWIARHGPPAAGGLVGHGLGVLGLLLMLVAETAYTWRKRPQCTGPGPVRAWMQVHVFAGLAGPFLVLLHGAFRFRGLAGVLTLVVMVVVASGVVGRFAYAGAPHSAAEPGAPRPSRARRTLSVWYLLHVPLSLALFALALVHALAALYYATLLR